MSTAEDWERDHKDQLDAMAAAVAEKDLRLAEDLMARIAPLPEGDNVHERTMTKGGIEWDEFEVIDPVTGKRSNTDGPARVKADGTRMWYWNGLQHNENGPAVIRPNGEVEYYYLGTRCKTAEDLDKMVERARDHAQKSKTWRDVKGDNSAA